MASVDIIQLLKSEGGEKFYPVTHKNAVIGLTEFFEAVPDNSGGISVRLRPEYTGLWADGWIAAGGIGSGGGGGGVSYLRALLDVYHNNAGVLRSDGTAVQNGDALVYDSTNSRWNAAHISGGGSYTLPAATASALGGIKVGSVISTPTINAISSTGGRYYYIQADSNGLAFVNVPWESGSGGGGDVSSITVNGTNYVPTSGVVTLPNYPTTLPASDVYSWAKQSSKPSYNFSEIGNTPTTLSGYGITDAKIANGVITLGSNTITPLTSFTETDPTVPSWAKQSSLQFSALPSLYVGKTPVKGTNTSNDTLVGIDGFTTAASASASGDTSLVLWEPNAGGSGVGAWHIYGNVYADGWISAGGIGSGGGGGGGVSYLRALLDVYHNSSGVLRSDGTAAQNGDSLVYNSANSRWNAAPVSGGGSYTLPAATASALGGIKVGSVITTPSINTISSTGGRYYYIQADSNGLAFVNVPWEGGGGGAVDSVTVGTVNYLPSGGVVTIPAYPTSLPASDVYSWAKAQNKPTYNFSEIGNTPTTLSGYGITDAKIANGTITLGSNSITPLTSHQTIYSLTLAAGTFSGGSYNPSSSAGSFNVPTTLDHISDGTNRKYSDFVHIAGSETISGSKTFSSDLTLSSNLLMSGNKHIDIGPVRIEYVQAENAIHITSNDNSTVNVYCDGYITAGGVNPN